MNRKLNIILILVAFAFACNQEQDVEKVKQQVAKLKSEKAKLAYEIDSLEKILLNDSTIKDDVFRVSVVVKTIKHESFNHFFEATGNVEAIESAFISPEINGQIKTIYVEEGDRVQKGQILLKLNSSVTQKGIEELKTGLELATKLYEKQKELWNQQIGSEIQFLQAKNNKESLEKKLETLNAQLEMAVLRAPFDGEVDGIFQKTGEIASPGRQVIQLVNLSKLKIRADVSEDYISKIAQGDQVEVYFPTFPDYIINTNIYRTGNVINPANRNFEIQLRIDNSDEKLKSNMLAVLKVKDYSTDSAFVVPSIIIKNDIEGEFVFVAKEIKGEYIAEKIRVKTGESYLENTIISNGLKLNDKLIVEGYNMVTSGVNVSIK